jgi:hypothetical protein
MTAYKSIKQHCKECMYGQAHEVSKCNSPDCFWYSWRSAKQPGSCIKAIRKFCLEECVGKEVGNRYYQVEICNPKSGCALHPFRNGKNPNPRKISEERRLMLSERMRNIRKIPNTPKIHRNWSVFRDNEEESYKSKIFIYKI